LLLASTSTGSDLYRVQNEADGKQINMMASTGIKSTIKVIGYWIVDNLDFLVITIGGIILSLRLFFPPYYYLDNGCKVPHEVAEQLVDAGIPPMTDYITALLQALGIAVVTAIIVYAIKRIKLTKVSVIPESEQRLEKSLLDRDRESRDKSYQATASDICSLTGHSCEYYDLRENQCFFGKEGAES